MPPRSHQIKINAKDRVSRYRARHEGKEHERDVWLVFMPADVNSMSAERALPAALIKIDPRPRVIEKPMDVAIPDDSKVAKAVSASLERLEVSRVSRSFTQEQLSPDFFIVAIVQPPVEVTPETVRAGMFPRYVREGPIALKESEYSFKLVHDNS